MSIEFPVTVRNLKPQDRVANKLPGMNVPMTGDPNLDNITILDERPPIFHNAPNYDIEQNPFSFIYCDMTYECNMECGFCDTPVRNYKDMPIELFEELCAKLPHPVAMRFVGGEPTLYKHLFKALEIATEYLSINNSYNHWSGLSTTPIQCFHAAGNHDTMMAGENRTQLLEQVTTTLKSIHHVKSWA